MECFIRGRREKRPRFGAGPAADGGGMGMDTDVGDDEEGNCTVVMPSSMLTTVRGRGLGMDTIPDELLLLCGG